ncbi:MAG: hypothetical protein M0R32_10990 [Candidatus Cloacimonetes bacterium]|jgi:hypothetical protein|nr:hypothetical protein [Candidatus Cloacimonadota bacterium]
MKIFAQARTPVNLQDLPNEILSSIGELAINNIVFVSSEAQGSPDYYVITLSDNSLNRSQIGKIASMQTPWEAHISAMAGKLTLMCFTSG